MSPTSLSLCDKNERSEWLTNASDSAVRVDRPKGGSVQRCSGIATKYCCNEFESHPAGVVAELADRVLPVLTAQSATYQIPIKPASHFSDCIRWIYMRELVCAFANLCKHTRHVCKSVPEMHFMPLCSVLGGNPTGVLAQ